MCGIAGVIGLNRPMRESDVSDVHEMTRLIRHRGPDQTAFHHDEACVLGNARLKIIDFSHEAALPMQNEDGSIVLVYNGEVTNFRELKSHFALERSHRFKSQSDSEVLIHLYEELGIDFVQHLSGMFAFCLFDRTRQKAFVVRDFYGIRPLFYMITPKTFYFSSEIKSFLPLDSFSDDIDHEGIYHFLSLAYIPGEHTPFRCVRELEGSHMFEIDLRSGTCENRAYYTISYAPTCHDSEEIIAKEVHSRLLDSVRRNLISDAPLGLTLSGGFDTSTLLALARESGYAKDLHTFSIKMGEKSFDESPFQRLMADFAGSIHHEILVRPSDVEQNIIEHMAYMDEPSGDGAAIPSFILAKKAKKYVSVLLSGEGGDEVFNAYETHRAFKMRKLYRAYMPALLRGGIKECVKRLPLSYKKLSFDFVAKRFVEGSELSTAEAHHYWRHALSREEKTNVMPAHAAYRPTEMLFVDLFNALPFDDDLNKISLIDIVYYFIGDLMVKNDRTMMAHSVEARFPYMDRLLLEYVSTIPPHLRMKGIRGRYIQKKAMQHSLPNAILRRSNMGLEMPHSLWFMKELNPLMQRCLTKKNIEKTGFLSHSGVQQMVDQHMRCKKDNGRSLWCIMNLLIWFDLFVYNKDYKRYLSC